tara:strand:- start:161 stop:892 length:732 start_codon:yes stop_codon:yes gene_type:complete
MDIILYSTIILISIVQSIFGVGVLLFGTPLFMLYNHDFTTTLLILLPISITISLLQTIKGINSIDISFFKGFLIYSIPFVIVFLAIGVQKGVNFNLLTGVFLVFVSLRGSSIIIEKTLKSLRNYDKLSFIAMGIIHGLTNLGGSLLTAIVFNKNLLKNQMRSTIAICYAAFAIFQILTLVLITGLDVLVSYFNLNFFLVGIFSFFSAEKLIYSKMDMEKYDKSFSFFLLLSGFSLIVKNFYEY